MTPKAPSNPRHAEKSLAALADQFPTDRASEEWLEHCRWPAGVVCPGCSSHDVLTRAEEKRRNQPHRCRNCRKDFSVKTGTIMHASNLRYRTWVLAIYMLTANADKVSSMQMHRELGVTQKTAWLLARRIRKGLDDFVGLRVKNKKPPPE